MIDKKPDPHVKLTEKEYAFIIDSYFSDGVVAGFTKTSLLGNPPVDMKRALAFRSQDFGVCYMNQVHGGDVMKVRASGIYTCDGIFTDKKRLVLVVKTADCLPLVFYSPKEKVIGGVHMGWRSANELILNNIPYDLSSFKVAALVGMRKCCYEVGDEFLEHENLRSHITSQNGKHYFDPLAFAKDSLLAKGLKEENFLDLRVCNYCSDQNLFSHRRNATPNRTLNFILMP